MGAIWTPLPPSPSGIADYAATIYGVGEEFANARFVAQEPEEQARQVEGRLAARLEGGRPSRRLEGAKAMRPG